MSSYLIPPKEKGIRVQQRNRKKVTRTLASDRDFVSSTRCNSMNCTGIDPKHTYPYSKRIASNPDWLDKIADWLYALSTSQGVFLMLFITTVLLIIKHIL